MHRTEVSLREIAVAVDNVEFMPQAADKLQTAGADCEDDRIGVAIIADIGIIIAFLRCPTADCRAVRELQRIRILIAVIIIEASDGIITVAARIPDHIVIMPININRVVARAAFDRHILAVTFDCVIRVAAVNRHVIGIIRVVNRIGVRRADDHRV